MTALEIKTLPTMEKFQIMEAIWEDLRERFDASEVSPALRGLLDERRGRVRRGDAKILDWDAVKSTIGRA